ncbi:MAG: ferritin family protein [Burkholderiales bacterium]
MTAARSKAGRKPVARKPAAKKTAATKPAAKKTTAKKAAAKRPAVKKTAAKKPAAAKPSAKAPAARKPAPRAKAGAGAPASIATLMTYALWLELDAVERYRELADAMEMHNNRDVSELFRKMAAIEGKHADKIMKQMAWTKVPPLPPGPSPWPGFESPETVAHEEVHYLMQPWHALSLALKGEERAHRFFARLAGEATAPAVKRAATEMADEEREHVELVRSWMTKVPRPDDDWREDPDPPRYTD